MIAFDSLRIACHSCFAVGVEHIKKALMVNTTLQKLSIHYNNIGDDGLMVMSEAIKHSKSLTILWVWKCGFSLKGILLNNALL